MATFYGGVSGNRGDATRQGSKDSGMAIAKVFGVRPERLTKEVIGES